MSWHEGGSAFFAFFERLSYTEMFGVDSDGVLVYKSAEKIRQEDLRGLGDPAMSPGLAKIIISPRIVWPFKM